MPNCCSFEQTFDFDDKLVLKLYPKYNTKSFIFSPTTCIESFSIEVLTRWFEKSLGLELRVYLMLLKTM